MIPVKIDLTGRVFGRLTVICQADDYIYPNGRRAAKWLCRCCCKDKNEVVVVGAHLKAGKTLSCGCYARERVKETLKKYNSYEICGDYVIMYTTKGEPFYIDLEDFDKVKDICWHKDKKGYIYGAENQKILLLHRLVMNVSNDMVVDHKHGRSSRNDNRKSNLRIGTQFENMKNIPLAIDNTSGATGVHWSKSNQKWCVRIGVNNKRIYLGYYATFDEAVRVRKEAEQKYFGEWSYDNSQNNVTLHSDDISDENL